MKVNDERISMMLTAFYKVRSASEYRYITVERTGSRRQKELELAINWAACGTQSVENAKVFAENLMKTCTAVETINALKLEVEYTEEPIFESEEQYYAEEAKVVEMVLNYRIGELIAWLLA